MRAPQAAARLGRRRIGRRAAGPGAVTRFRPSLKLLAGSALANASRVSRGVALACGMVLATVLAMAGAAPAVAKPASGQASLAAAACSGGRSVDRVDQLAVWHRGHAL